MLLQAKSTHGGVGFHLVTMAVSIQLSEGKVEKKISSKNTKKKYNFEYVIRIRFTNALIHLYSYFISYFVKVTFAKIDLYKLSAIPHLQRRQNAQ